MISCMIAANAGRYLWRWISPIETRREGRPCARIGAIFRVSAIMTSFLLVACTDGGLIEVESNIGWAEIDKIIRKEGHSPSMNLLSNKIRAFLIERERDGGAAAVELSLSEAGASCLASSRRISCQIIRSHVMRSADLFNARHVKTAWVISISYERDGKLLKNIRVTDSSESLAVNPH